MDIPYGAWFPELDGDFSEFMSQHQQTRPYCEFADSSSSPSFNGYQNLVTREQSINAATISRDLDKQDSYMPTSTSSFAPIGGSSSSTFTLSFGDFNSSTGVNQNQVYGGYNLEYHHDATKRKDEMSLNELLGSMELPKRAPSTRRNHRQAKEHIMAERKRREKLTQRFISLAALLPEIKKMDKATVLDDASKYIKNLQNRVKELEETSISVKNVIQESTTSMSKSKSHGELEASYFDETNSLPCNADYNPGIKVRIIGSNVLVRIYCQRNSSLALKALMEMERLHFTVMCNSVLPISSNAALITIIAQMSEEFAMAANDLVKCLRLSLSNLL